MLTDKAYLVLATAGALVIMVVTTTAGWWPWWVGAVLCLVLIFGGLYLKNHFENQRLHKPAPQPIYQPPPPPPPMPPASTAVQGLVLPSAQRDYHFLLNATILWRHTGMTHQRPDQLAIDAIRERATLFTERESAADTDLIAPRLATDLSTPGPDRTGQLEVWAQDTTLTIPADDRERLSKLAQIRKNEELWEHERAYERNKRTYLREDVLSSTGSAVVWWLARDTARVQETVDLIDTLTKLVAAAQNREVDPVLRTFVDNLTDPSPHPTTTPQDDLVDRLMAAILPNGSEPERADIADRMATLATEAGATDLAHTLRARFNAPDFTTTPNVSLFAPTETDPIPDTPSHVHPNGHTEPGTSNAS